MVVPSIYAMYRVFHGIFEAKLESLKQSYPLPARNVIHVYQYEVDATFLRLCQTITVTPEPIRRIINAIGILKYNEII